MEHNGDAFLTLLSAAQGGDAQAERTLVEQNMPLVVAMAKRYLSRGVELEDLIQLGSIGLIQAIRRFDASYSVCLSTYAVPLILGEIKRYLRDDGPIHVTRSLKELSSAAEKALQSEPELTVEELAERLSVTPSDLAAAFASRKAPLSLEAEQSEDGNPLLNRLCAKDALSPLHNRMVVQDLMKKLTERERTILTMRYFQELTQAEIGAKLSLSQVQISRLEKKILEKLRSHITKQETVD